MHLLSKAIAKVFIELLKFFVKLSKQLLDRALTIPIQLAKKWRFLFLRASGVPQHPQLRVFGEALVKA